MSMVTSADNNALENRLAFLENRHFEKMDA